MPEKRSRPTSGAGELAGGVSLSADDNARPLRKGARIQRLRALPPAEAWAAVRAMDDREQVALWLDLFRRTFDTERYEAAREQAEAAVGLLRASGKGLEEWLVANGISVLSSTAAATFGTATIRAWVEGSAITIYESPLATLENVFARCGDGAPSGDSLRAAVLAHEVFHCLAPSCPGKLAETAAHLFASRVSGLDCFAGLLDVLQALSRWW